MRFSSRFGTAIHTLLLISEYSKTQKVTSDFIALQIDISPVSVRKLLGDLKKAGIVNIAPRKEKEGTTIARPLNKITLLDIFMVAEPNQKEDINIPSTRHANTCYSGIYVNEIILDYADTALKAVFDAFAKITLSDAFDTLKKKEAECPESNPRELLSKENIKRIIASGK